MPMWDSLEYLNPEPVNTIESPPAAPYEVDASAVYHIP